MGVFGLIFQNLGLLIELKKKKWKKTFSQDLRKKPTAKHWNRNEKLLEEAWKGTAENGPFYSVSKDHH